MISYTKKCIFVHIPKTGGGSIEKIIWPKDRKKYHLWKGFIKPHYNKYQTDGLQHLFATHIQQEVGDQVFNNFFKFSFIRNPYDKAVSQFWLHENERRLKEIYRHVRR